MTTIVEKANSEASNGYSTEGQSCAVVIGSGFGGLATAIRLRHLGMQVTLLEKLDQLGGRANCYQVGEFQFDAGPTVITAPYLIKELFDITGRKMEDYIELLSVYPFYRVHFDDGSYFDYGSPEDNIQQIAEIAPSDVEGYRKMLEKIKPIFDAGFKKHAFQEFRTMGSMMKIIPEMIKLNAITSNYSFVSKYIKDERLRKVFSFHPLLIGGNPFSVPAIYSLIQYLEKEWGVWFVKGGTFQLVQALGSLFDELGGIIRLNAPVKRILVTDGQATGVMTEEGEVISADYVISNADVATTYTKMLDRKWRRKNRDRRYKRAKFSMSLFLIYFGTDKQYPELKHHTILLGKRYKQLLSDIFDRKILSDDFSAYLHAPARTDPTIAPSGKDAFYILVPVPNLKAGIDWETKQKEFRDLIINYLSDTVMPDLEQHIIAEKIITPIDFKDRYQAMHGSAFSLEPRLIQSAYFRPRNTSEDVKNLYMVGAGTHPGAGVPGVISSAKITTEAIIRDWRK